MTVAAYGLLVADLYLDVVRLPESGESIDAVGYEVAYGGKAANQAGAAAMLGADVRLFAAVGADARGADGLDELRAHGVDVAGVRVVPGGDTGFSVIVLAADGDQTIVTHPGAAIEGMPTPADVAAVTPSVLLLQGELGADAALDAARAIPGPLVILDPSPVVGFIGRDLSAAHVITPNIHEARLLTGLAEPTAADVAAATGAATVIVTRGGDGLELFQDGTSTTFPSITITPVDASGAGDGFNGGLAAGLDAGQSLEEAIAWAVGASAWSAGRRHCLGSYPSSAELSAWPAYQQWREEVVLS